ncbi:MAG: cupin domain-containing protein [Planctomycetota bacterium]
MKLHNDLDQDLLTRLFEYASGNLTVEEEHELEAHLEQCPTCRNGLAWLRPTVDALHFAPAPAAAPGGVWDRVRERIGLDGCGTSAPEVQPWKSWRADTGAEGEPGSLVARASELAWSPTAIDGIEVRRLAVDAEAAFTTMMIRMAPGTSYPAHVHAGAEECYVLEGDLVIGDLRMTSGDFQRMEPGSQHPDQHTEGGCLLLLRSSLDDRLL